MKFTNLEALDPKVQYKLSKNTNLVVCKRIICIQGKVKWVVRLLTFALSDVILDRCTRSDGAEYKCVRRVNAGPSVTLSAAP
jgi:hypothetical protein